MRSLVLSVVVCAGCFGSSDVDLSGIETALIAGASIGHSASMTAAAMSAPVACVDVSPPSGSGQAVPSVTEAMPLHG